MYNREIRRKSTVVVNSAVGKTRSSPTFFFSFIRWSFPSQSEDSFVLYWVNSFQAKNFALTAKSEKYSSSSFPTT